MGWPRLRRTAFLIGVALLVITPGRAQEAPSPAPTAPSASTAADTTSGSPDQPAKSPDGARELEIFYLPDANGNLRQVINFPLEEFKRARDLLNQLAGGVQRPSFSIQSLNVSGVAIQDSAELTVDMDIVVYADDWVRIPVLIPELVLGEPPSYTGDGQFQLDFDETAASRVCWLRGKPQSVHHVSFTGKAPLTRGGEEQRLALRLPRSAVSNLRLQVPIREALVRVNGGALLDTKSAMDGNATTLHANGLSGSVELFWRPQGPSKETAETQSIDVVGSVMASVEARRIRADATLVVRSFDGPIERLAVRLPPGSVLVPNEVAQYKVTALPASAAERAGGQVVNVTLAQPSPGPFEVRLSSERPRGGNPDEPMELAGFEVLGAGTQSGYLAVRVASDWRVLFEQSQQVRRVDEAVLPASLQEPGLVAAFEYSAQPCSLLARVSERESHVGVEPRYRVMVDADELRLEGVLKYSLRGAKILSLSIDMPGWQIDRIGPAKQINLRGLLFGEVAPLIVQLTQPMTGELELEISAHRDLPLNGTLLDFELPVPQANSLAPTILVVQPADNVELVPRTRNLLALGSTDQPIIPDATKRQQPPLVYRAEPGRARFAAEFRLRPRTVTVGVVSELTLEETQVRVDQRMTLDVKHEPLPELHLQVPNEFPAPERLEVTVNDQPAQITSVPRDEEDEAPRAYLIPLSGGLLGTSVVRLRYTVELGGLVPETSLALRVPLAMPQDGALEANELRVNAKSNVNVQPQGNSRWQVVATADAGQDRRRGLRLAARERANEVALAVNLENARNGNATVIERAWIQTWLGERRRDDRAVYRFTSRDNQIELSVPPGVARDDIEVVLDGAATSYRTAADGKLIIAWPLEPNEREHVLELRYHSEGRKSTGGALRLASPQFGGGVWHRHLYWQVVLPRNEHIVGLPESFTSEFTWGWDGLVWGRQPLLEQSQLETWCGATHLAPLPSGTNRYLFSALGSRPALEVHTQNRATIVLFASGLALITGLILIYVPLARHPAVVFTVSLALLTGAALYPELALLFAQSAGLGLLLTLVAGWLERGVARRRARLAPPGTSTYPLERPAAEPVVRTGAGSTETAALAVPASDPGSKP